MAAFLARKHLGALRPVDERGEQALRGLRQGDIVRVEVRRPRNVRHHRLFWALATLVHDNLPEDLAEACPTVEDLVALLKIATGHRSTIALKDGSVAYVPRSISFARMDQAEFDAFFDRCCDVVARRFLPGITRADLRREVEEMIGASLSTTERQGA